MVDPDGNFVLSSFLVTIGIGAAIGAGISAATYSIGAAASETQWNFKDFIKQVGLGTLGGAVTAGFGSIGGSVATNMFYSAIGNGVSYGLTSAIKGNEMSAGGFGAALLGGLAGGLMPSYGGLNNLAGGALAKNAFRSIGGELVYGGAKGALMGGISSTIETGSFKNFGKGAAYGALSGAVGTGAKMAWSGRIYNTGYESALAKTSNGKSNSLYAPGFRKGGISQAIAYKKATEDSKPGGFYNRKTGQLTMVKNDPRYIGHEFKHYMQATELSPIEFSRQYRNDFFPFETEADNFGARLMFNVDF
jgi:hypothetical protein